MPKVLKGRIVSGLGNFSYWIDRLQGYYKDKTGMNLFPGTLNLQLEEPFDLPIDGVIRFEKEEYGGTVSVSLIPCTVMGRKAFVLRTDANAREERPHPKTIIEIATDVKLRDAYSLIDGDIVEVELYD